MPTSVSVSAPLVARPVSRLALTAAAAPQNDTVSKPPAPSSESLPPRSSSVLLAPLPISVSPCDEPLTHSMLTKLSLPSAPLDVPAAMSTSTGPVAWM
jgi:hypothetical protein